MRTRSSIHTKSLVVAVTVTCERWLCAPRSEIFFEHGHRLVTGTTHLGGVAVAAVFDFADEGDVVVEQALARRRPGAVLLTK